MRHLSCETAHNWCCPLHHKRRRNAPNDFTGKHHMEQGGTIVSELEGTLLHDSDLFPYFMLIAFETSGLLRFIVLLLAWPFIRLLDLLHMGDLSLQIMVFIAVAGVKVVEIETVASSVLPKFFVDVIDTVAWNAFMSFEQQVVVTRCPRLMVERFAKEYLRADGVIGAELHVNRFGYATGLLKRADRSISDRVMEFLGEERPDATMGRAESKALLGLGKEQLQPPYWKQDCQPIRPPRVIFHDGRLVHRPTPLASLAVIFWIPIGIVLVFLRISVSAFPIRYALFFTRLLGGNVLVRGRPPPRASGSTSGVLFVCTHRTLMDPVVLATVLGRSVPAVTYSLSRLSEILSPIPTVRLTRNRQADAERIRAELAKGDLAVCPEGTTCREPFLLRFSALFAELTDRIVPVAMNNRVGLFHGTTARGWKAMDPIFFLMNPRPFYEVTFLEQLPIEATCAGGKSPHDVANHVQKILASALGFECTNFTRKHKYRALVGHDGRASFKRTASFKRMTSFKRTASLKRTRSQKASQFPK